MKKRLLILLSLCLAIVVVYAVWVQFPRIQQPDQLAAIISSAQTRWDKVQSEAENKEKNGFLSPSFLPVWGRKDKEGKGESEAGQALKAWNDYSSPAMVEVVDHPAKQDNAKYKAALANIEKLEPEMLKIAAMPVFVAPDGPPSFDTLVMNFIGVRSMAQAMVGLAENRMVQDRPAEAIQLIDAVVVWGRTQQNGGALISEMIATAIQQIGADAWIGLIPPDEKLSAAQWREAARSLTSAVPSKNQIADSLETELWTARNTVARIQDGTIDKKSADELFMLPLPGYAERESRIFSNQMVRVITDLQAGKGPEIPKFITNPGVMDYLSGAQGVLASLMMTNYPRASSVADYSRKRIMGLALVAATRAFLAENKRLPKTLEELMASGIPMPKDLDKDNVTFTSGAKGVTFDLSYAKNPNLDSPRENTFGKRDWADEATMGKLIYRVSANK